MGVLDSVKNLMLDSIVVEPYEPSSVDVEGNPAYGSSYIIKGRVVERPQMLRDSQGREVVSMSRAYIDEASNKVGEQDRITLPNGRQPTILRVVRAPDSTGQNSVTIYFEG